MQTQNASLTGEWSGSKKLYLSGTAEPDNHCDSSLSVHAVAMGKFLELRYTWSYEQHTHEGLLLLASNPETREASAAWVDSWHQSTSIMNLKGSVDAKGAYSLTGSFSVPDSPDWGWRMEITPGDELSIRMFNVTPTGEGTLAVEMQYQQEPFA